MNMKKSDFGYLFLAFFTFTFVIYFLSLHKNPHKSLPISANEYVDGMKKPNFIFILTDDQDSLLRSMDIMNNTYHELISAGINFTNSFVASPLCCPSRSSILTGQYVHNHKAINNSISGGCSSPSWQRGPEKKSFPYILHQNGYQTFFAGKYLNQYGTEHAGGISHVPPGWDWWIGLKGNSVYYNYSLSVNGTLEQHSDNPNEDYLTNVIKKRSLEFLDKAVSPDKPFFMMLSTPACHAPFDSEPKYMNNFTEFSAPRTKNFNVVNDHTKHWLLRLGEQPLKSEIVDKIDETYRKRLRTLLSVDDMVKAVITNLRNQNLLDSTYVIFTSDNGYHLGQFSLPLDKREPYEFDIRVPFFIRGPGITQSSIDYPITNIDIAPTVIDLAGIEIPKYFDGKSFKFILEMITDVNINEAKSSTLQKERNLWYPYTNMHTTVSSRKTTLVEHSGEGHNVNHGCQYLGTNLSGCNPEFSCKCEDSKNNTYSCLRHISENENFIYCAWDDEERFEEYYDLIIDRDQLNNSINIMKMDRYKKLCLFLKYFKKCRGMRCRKLSHFVF